MAATDQHYRNQKTLDDQVTSVATSAAPDGSRYHHSVRRNEATNACGSTLRLASHASTAEMQRPTAARA